MRNSQKLKRKLVENSFDGNINQALMDFFNSYGYNQSLNTNLFKYLTDRGYTGQLSEKLTKWEKDDFALESIHSLFVNGEQGVWYDPSDTSTLFQDTTGTTPVTAAGQTVGLALDKSQGLVLGPELWASQDPDINDFGGSSGSYDTVTQTMENTGTGSNTSYPRFIFNLPLDSNKSYYVEGRIDGDRLGVNNVRIGNDFSTGTILYNSTTGEFRGTRTPNSPSIQFIMDATVGNLACQIAEISVRELPGNHATQATAAQRPTYGIVPKTGRRNLLTWTEDFGNTVWTKAGIVAAQENGAEWSLTENTSTGLHRLLTTNGTTTSVNSTNTIEVKPNGRDRVALLHNSLAGASFLLTGSGSVLSGTGQIEQLADGFYRLSVTRATGDANERIVLNLLNASSASSYTGDGTSGVIVRKPQLEAGSTPTPYQRVTSQFDVTEAGVPSLGYLSFDGVDDFMATPTITPGTDKVQVFAGVRKLSPSTFQTVLEFSTSISSNNGAWVMQSPSASDIVSRLSSKGTTQTFDDQTTAVAPATFILTGQADISGDSVSIRVNGTNTSAVTDDQGTGNYLAYPMYLGARAGSSLFFNGNLYSLITRFGPNLDSAQIASAESYVATKTGVTL